MRKPVVFTVLLNIPFIASALAAESTAPAPRAITREVLPSVQLPGEKKVERVEIQRLSFAANQKPGAHIHTSPVVGYVIEGTILFQVDGQPEQILKAGDAFFEPADTKISHFDSGDQPAKFVAYTLLGKDEQNAIKMAP